MKRVFLIVLDSFGIGALPDAADYGDAGCNTLASVFQSGKLKIPTMQGLGLYNMDGVEAGEKTEHPAGAFARLAEQSKGKDTTIGHWEIAGIISPRPLPTYPNGFPPEIVAALEGVWGRKLLCNKPYSGTQVIADYGVEHLKTGGLITYTSADSVLQIAAHEELIPPAKLYEYCKMAREVMTGEHEIGRIIARPFVGEVGSFARTANRHDYSLAPPAQTVMDALVKSGREVIAVGKIGDIFAGRGVSESTPTKSNRDGMARTDEMADRDFDGLCFVNLVDFDMVFGHRNDIGGYAAALNDFDSWLAGFIPRLRADDLCLITADHGCDPGFPGTDHTREYVPMIAVGPGVKQGTNLGTRASFSDIAATIEEAFGLPKNVAGASFLREIQKI
ncbi:MAG: phosphopentomutase [Oscillospiraceae bacterium]|nr:phosphopentomutase [Oscillospiraceae bacterium]